VRLEVRNDGESHGTLADGLRSVAEDDERLGASNAVGLRLLAEVQAIADARRRRTMAISLAAAAALAAVIAVPAWRALQAPADVPAEDPVITRELVTEFFPLRYSNVPARGGYVVRMQVPRTAMASFGATAPAGISNDPNILADVVVGDDGLARAVRFVQVIHGNPADHLRQGDGGQEAGLHEQEQTP
jgi:hypothetical protein